MSCVFLLTNILVYQFLIKIQWEQIILKSFCFSNYAVCILSLVKISEDKEVESHLLGLMLDLNTRHKINNYNLIVIKSLHHLWDYANLFSYIFYLVFMTFDLKNLKMIIFWSKHVVLCRIKRQKCLFTWVDMLRYSFSYIGAGRGLLTPRSGLINLGIARYPLYWGSGGSPGPIWTGAEILAPTWIQSSYRPQLS
jgi:hypothetical protein